MNSKLKGTTIKPARGRARIEKNTVSFIDYMLKPHYNKLKCTYMIPGTYIHVYI